MTWFTPFRATLLALFLMAVVFLDLTYAATHHRAQIDTQIGCAMTLTKSGTECK